MMNIILSETVNMRTCNSSYSLGNTALTVISQGSQHY